MRRESIAALVLLFLSPLIAEVLSGSTTPTEFINPIALVLLLGLYGTSALLIRELKVRQGLSYASVLVLGFAYGVLEEGLATKSFFDPYWPDCADFLCQFGRVLGVNWVWSAGLTVYHGFWSILVPIITVEIFFPDIAEESWLSNKSIAVLLTALAIDVVVINAVISRYKIGISEVAGSLLAIVFLSCMAKLVHRTASGKLLPQKVLAAVSIATSLTFFLVFYVCSYTIKIPVLTVALLTVIAYVMYVLSKQLDITPVPSLSKAAIAVGSVVVLAVLIMLQALSGISELFISSTAGVVLAALVLSKGRSRVRIKYIPS